MEIDAAISSFLVVEKAESRQRKMDRAAAQVGQHRGVPQRVALRGQLRARARGRAAGRLVRICPFFSPILEGKDRFFWGPILSLLLARA